MGTGKYIVTITDNSGCKATDSVTLSKQDVKSAIAILTLPTCSGKTDGSVQADFNKILPPGPSLKWIGTGNQIGDRYTNIGKGKVGLIVTDAKGCADTAFVNLTTKKELTADITKDSVQCFNANDGRIVILNRRFTNGDPLTNDSVFITTPLGVKNYFPLAAVRYFNIGVGSYPIFIKDQLGCTFRDTAIITQPALLDTSKILIKPESCFPGNDGSISITMKGGTAPYKFTWAGFPKDTNVRSNLTQGNYNVIITDKKGCQTNFNNLSFPFSRPVVPVSIDTTAILCFGQGATLTAKADPKYIIKSYAWSNGDSSASAKNVLANKPAWVVVTDVQGCKGSDTIVLSQPARLKLIDSTIIPSICPGLDQGIIRLSVSGGTGPYLYNLSGGPAQNVGQFPRLKSGKYTVTIIDSKQCPSLVVNTEIVEPPKIVGVFDTASFRGVKCAGTGNCTGQARLLLFGGTDLLNRFSVRWESGEVTANSIVSTAESLCAGNQQVSVTDGNGCNTKLQFTITSIKENILLKPDIQTVKYQTAQNFDVLANDNIATSTAVNININFGLNGEVSYSNTTGKNVYTPRKGFSGKEVINYKVCLVSCPEVCSTSTIEFNVEPPCNDKTNLMLPNVIFPEGLSGDNRYFIVEALIKCPEAFGPKPTRFMVYSRWGDLVYSSNDYKNDWDGTNTQGQSLPAGTYYYLLDLGSVNAPVQGYVVIMR